jgi:hypothetical protein
MASQDSEQGDETRAETFMLESTARWGAFVKAEMRPLLSAVEPGRLACFASAREVLEHINPAVIDRCIDEWDRVGKGRRVHIIAVTPPRPEPHPRSRPERARGQLASAEHAGQDGGPRRRSTRITRSPLPGGAA